MDIVGPLLITESAHSYILTIQDLITKYSVVLSLRQAMSSEIAKALAEMFINSYTAPKAWVQLEFYKQYDALYTT